jgi:hypothetical protein
MMDKNREVEEQNRLKNGEGRIVRKQKKTYSSREI